LCFVKIHNQMLNVLIVTKVYLKKYKIYQAKLEISV
jgi:hypothetical protein